MIAEAIQYMYALVSDRIIRDNQSAQVCQPTLSHKFIASRLMCVTTKYRHSFSAHIATVKKTYKHQDGELFHGFTTLLNKNDKEKMLFMVCMHFYKNKSIFMCI